MDRILKTLFCLSILQAFFLHAEWNAEEYEKSSSGQFAFAVCELPKLKLSGSESILDVGCGDGKISLHIAKKFVPNGHVDGLDKDESMISFASANIKAQASNISFIYGDIVNFKSLKQYDVVVSFWCLHWVEDYGAALKNIAELLHTKGKALLCHVVEYNPWERWIQQALQKPRWLKYSAYYVRVINPPSLESVLAAIRESKLSIEHLEIKKNSEWRSIEMCKKNWLSMPIFDFIPRDEREQFFDDVIKEYSSENQISTDNKILFWLPVIVMVLQK